MTPSSAASTPPGAAQTTTASRRVAIVALPDAMLSTLAGVYDVLNARPLVGLANGPTRAAFDVQIVGEAEGPLPLASGVPIQVQRAVERADDCDIVIVPSLLLMEQRWRKDRYPRLTEWLAHRHDQGAVICSACSGIFLLAETGLFDGRDATVHFNYARQFSAAYPQVTIHPERALVVSGQREELVSSGASATWHDLVLYLIARFAGATDAQDTARAYALQWHHDGLTPYITFEGRMDHGDAEVAAAQRWLAQHFATARPVEEAVRQSTLAERTFKRRFTAATGLSPIDYVQRLRVEDAKRRLERTDEPVDEVSWRVGYEDAAFFRRLFKRTTGLAPGAYRRRFGIPEFARR